MKSIFKYTLKGRPGVWFKDVLKGAEVLSVKIVDGSIRLWAEVDTEAGPDRMMYEIAFTGQVLEDRGPFVRRYIGTVFEDSGLVYHVYELVEEGDDS